MIGTYPTPVQLASELSSERCRLWIKRDDCTGQLYGGNKVRKLERILGEAERCKAKRIVTFGAAGSHHVLATTLYGTRAGFKVAAVLTPQPDSPHAQNNLRTAMAWGLEAWPASTPAAAMLALARHRRHGDYVVAPGGSSLLGTLGFVDGARELAEQVDRGEVPVPDVVVAALGSGGTVAGLLAGFAVVGLKSRVVAVRIVSPWLAGPRRVVALAWRAAGHEGSSAAWGVLARHLEVEGGYLGAGYGCSTEAGRAAARQAVRVGISVEPTYTAKAFAAALDLVREGASREILYWHTLSGTCPPPARLNAVALPELPAELQALFVPDRGQESPFSRGAPQN